MLRIPIIEGQAGEQTTAQSVGDLAQAVTAQSVLSGGTGKFTSPTNRGAGKKSGGGGGSKQKTKEKDVTRYHEINAKLEQMSAELEKINTIKDRA